MINLSKNHLKRVISSALVCTMSATMLQCFPDNRFLVNAEETNQKYPYTMFAASSNEGAITVNANNFCVNGNARNNPTTNTNTASMRTLWYYEDGMGSPCLSYDKMQAKYFYLLSARNFANERFLTLEKTGIISKWTKKEAINIAKTNQTWLSKNYLEKMGLIFGHKNI